MILEDIAEFVAALPGAGVNIKPLPKQKVSVQVSQETGSQGH